MDSRQVLNKQDMYKLYFSGAFGNTPRSWISVDEMHREGYAGRVGIRGLKPDSRCFYNAPQCDVERLVDNFFHTTGYILNEYVPDDRRTCNGEYYHNHTGHHLYFSTLQLPMREALFKDGAQLSGVRALEMCKFYMNPNSYADFEVLRDQYPTAVIEFTTFDTEFGTVPGRNTVIWEVRDY